MAVRRMTIILAASLIMFSIPLYSDNITDAELNTFTAGTPASASEVNTNFDAVQAAVNDNDQRIDSLEGTGGITSAQILDGTITAADLASNSVYAAEIAANAVGASEIATGAVGTSEIADNSIQAVDMLDEAGLEYSTTTSYPVDSYSSSSPDILRSATVSAPAAGYILVTGTGYFYFSHSSSYSERYQFGVSSSSTSFPIYSAISVPSTAGAGSYRHPVMVQYVFYVSGSGNYNYYFLAYKMSSSYANGTMYYPTLTALYVPTRR